MTYTNTKKSKHSHDYGFTLVELLIAIGLVGIVIAAATTMILTTMKFQKNVALNDDIENSVVYTKQILSEVSLCTLNLKDKIFDKTLLGDINPPAIAVNQIVNLAGTELLKQETPLRDNSAIIVKSIVITDLSTILPDTKYMANLKISFLKPAGSIIGPAYQTKKIPVLLLTTAIPSTNNINIDTCYTNSAAAPTSSAHGEQSFSASGVFNVPPDVTTVRVKVWGGGGGGSPLCGGGGGAGGYTEGLVTTVPGSSMPVTVGLGGSAPSVGCGSDISPCPPGQNGGNSSFAGLVATGGGGGNPRYYMATSAGGGSGGTGSGGTLNQTGESGGGSGGGCPCTVIGSGGNQMFGFGKGGAGGDNPNDCGFGGIYPGQPGSPGFVLISW